MAAVLAILFDKFTKLLRITENLEAFLEHGSPILHNGSGMPQHSSAETRSIPKAEC